ncbi:hypothetical protein [Glutamicibacter arilaitensis]|uniref:hypothetical protein n=1 Tax=Glutamicibacter arilaitensis TaxID=256701 RepID=UPI00384E937D
MQKFDIINNSERVIRTVEATNYRLVDGYFNFKKGDRLVLSISSGAVSIIEEVTDGS